ncbi:MAG: DNA adenine methylase [Methylovulum sp.]|nr:DNA adenine methylase [Methylovulum sp.]
MRFTVPHPIPYQGSKRRLATAILSHVPANQYTRLIEPFAGSAAVSLAAASRNTFSSFVIGDALEPLIKLWNMVIVDPTEAADEYSKLWHREREKPIEAYYEIRSEFNVDRSPTKLLYLLARCVKNAVRFNPAGEFNQSPDKRRKGTRPQLMKEELFAAHRVLAGRSQAVYGDFFSMILSAQKGDFFYLDPPYQGTSEGRDQRYISGVSRDRMVEALAVLNEKRIPFILSYDGFCGERNYGDPLPEAVAHRILLDVGRSSQATLNGRNDVTIESLYVSHCIPVIREVNRPTRSLGDFAEQATLFAFS